MPSVVVQHPTYGVTFVPAGDFHELFDTKRRYCWEAEGASEKFDSMSGGFDTYMQSYSQHARACGTYSGVLEYPETVTEVYRMLDSKPEWA